MKGYGQNYSVVALIPSTNKQKINTRCNQVFILISDILNYTNIL